MEGEDDLKNILRRILVRKKRDSRKAYASLGFLSGFVHYDKKYSTFAH
jgi:hypothetical protein